MICDAPALEDIEGYRLLPRVTSDTKPWRPGGTLTVCSACGAIQKLPDAEWLAEIDRIYRDYTLFHVSAGAEQLIFTGGAATPRSQLLIEWVTRDLPADGNLLDIGCGTGAGLINFAKALPAWRLFGSDLDDKTSPELREFPNFVQLFTEPLETIPERFTLVSMIHSLEHMVRPLDTLETAAALLQPAGRILVQVPDAETSPFDLLVADHLMHFSRRTIAALVARTNLVPVQLVNDFVPKEITMVADRGSTAPPPHEPSEGFRIADATVAWLTEVFAMAGALAHRKPFGIFGTAVAGMAVYGAVRDRVDFFVDEDRSRIGRDYEGRPIIAAEDAPAGATVFVPLAPPAASSVVKRLSGSPATFVAPPPMTLAERTTPS